MLIVVTIPVCAQTVETQQLILNWEKLEQLRKTLDNIYVTYRVLDRGYNTIKRISEGNYALHDVFFKGLAAISPTVRNYRRIPHIIEYQKLLVKEYKYAYNRFRQDPNLTFDELEYLASVYAFIVNASIRNLEDLITVITASDVQMSDAERMQIIDRIFFDMEDKVLFVRYFNNSTQLVAIQRARSRNDIRTMQQVYGIN